jgi:nucleoside-diphosphate-sugar epimerase
MRGQVDAFPAGRYSFVLARDVAWVAIAALDRGIRGEKYLAYGPNGEMTLGVDLLNLALHIAGLTIRVRTLRAEELQLPEVQARFGPALLRSADGRVIPTFDNSVTCAALDYRATELGEAATATVEWLRRLDPS